jgi:hypothetical protein
MPRQLQSIIHSERSNLSTVWANYRSEVNALLPTNTADINDHLVREFNRRVFNLGLNSLLIFPFDGGFRYLGDFNPLSLSPALWLSDTGSNAAQWDDLSGNERHATQATGIEQPAIVAGALNGRQVRRFDGSNDGMNMSNIGNFSRNIGAITIFAVRKFAVLPSTPQNIFRVNTSVGTTSRIFFGGGVIANKASIGGRRLNDGDSFQIATTANNSSLAPVLHCGEFHYSDAVLTQRINGQVDGQLTPFQTAGNTDDVASNYVAIGRENVGGFFNGDIAEIIVFEYKLTTDERQKIERYLSQKYNIALA